MPVNNRHYKRLIAVQKKTRLASCGFSDRFDPFVLNKISYLRELYNNLFKTFLSDIPHNNILDMGCGTGIYFDKLSQYAGDVKAMDRSEDMIRIAADYCKKNSLKNVFPCIGSAESIPFRDRSFDIVVGLDVLHHIYDIKKSLSEIFRVLKPGGHLFLFEPNICNPLVLFSHLIPKEERLAIKRNSPGRIMSLLEGRFETVQWAGVCAIITQTEGLRRVLLNIYLKLWQVINIERLYPRQALLGKKVTKAQSK